METAKLKARELAQTGVRISEVSLGLWGASGATTKALSDEELRALLSAGETQGITLVDVAPLWGTSEAQLGKALGALSAPEKMQVCTRGGITIRDGRIEWDYTRAGLRRTLDASKLSLRREHIDVWLLHDPPEEVLLDGSVTQLFSELKESGEIRAAGVSTSRIDVAANAIQAGIDVLCMPLNMLHFDDHADLLFDMEEAGTSFMARSPLSHGLLNGRWTSSRRFDEGDHRKERWRRAALQQRLTLVNQLRFMVRGDVRNLTAAALRFVLRRERVATAILGATRPSHLDALFDLVGDPPYLPDEDVQRLVQTLAAAGM